MSVVINTNVDSLKVQNCVTKSASNLSKAMERMSTGLKINSAKDNAAGCVIAAKMQVQLDGNQICQDNVQNANAMLSTVEGNVDVVSDNVTRIRDLVLQAKNGTYSDNEIDAMDKEVTERIAEIQRINDSAQYSDSKLFANEKFQKDGVTFQVGQNAGLAANTITADKAIFGKVTFSALTGLPSGFTLKGADLEDALTKLDTGVSNIADRKVLIGASQNRLDSASETLTTQNTNLTASKSLITDADIATEASEYTNSSILQQISASMLAQANQTPSVAMSLI